MMNGKTIFVIAGLTILLCLLSLLHASSGIGGGITLGRNFATDHFGWPLDCLSITTHRRLVDVGTGKWEITERSVHVFWGNAILTLIGALAVAAGAVHGVQAVRSRRSANQQVHGTQ